MENNNSSLLKSAQKGFALDLTSVKSQQSEYLFMF